MVLDLFLPLAFCLFDPWSLGIMVRDCCSITWPEVGVTSNFLPLLQDSALRSGVLLQEEEVGGDLVGMDPSCSFSLSMELEGMDGGS